MTLTARISTLLFVVALIVSVTGCAGCSDVPLPDVDDEQQRIDIEADYRGVDSQIDLRHDETNQRLEEADEEVGGIEGIDRDLFEL